MYNCVQRLSSQENKDKLSEISQKLITVISAIHPPSRRRFSRCHFGKFTVNLLVVLHVVLKLVNVTEHSSHYATKIHIISNHIV